MARARFTRRKMTSAGSKARSKARYKAPKPSRAKTRARYKPPGPPSGRRDYTRQRAAGPQVPENLKTTRGAATYKTPAPMGGLSGALYNIGQWTGKATGAIGRAANEMAERRGRWRGIVSPLIDMTNRTASYPMNVPFENRSPSGYMDYMKKGAATYGFGGSETPATYGNLMERIDPNMYQWWDQNVAQAKKMPKTINPYAELMERISPNMYQWWDQNVIPPTTTAPPTTGGGDSPQYPTYPQYPPYPRPRYGGGGGGGTVSYTPSAPPRQTSQLRAPTQTNMPEWISKMTQWRGL